MSVYKKRWKILYNKAGDSVSVLQQLSLSDIRLTIGKARDEGNTTPVAGNVKPWLLQHILEDINKKGKDTLIAEKVVITETKKTQGA